MDKYEQMPKRARVNHGEAWWYANPSSIEIHVRGKEGEHFIVKMFARDLEKFVEWRRGRG